MSVAFDTGVEEALRKLAALDTTVHEVVTTIIKANLPKGHAPSLDDELETLLPEDGELESVVSTVEDNFDITLDSDLIFALFAGGTVQDLEEAVIDALKEKTPSKTAASDSHAYYMRNRARRKQQARQYRMRNLHKIRRRSRIYRRQVARGARRPRRRMGSAAGGFTFVPR